MASCKNTAHMEVDNDSVTKHALRFILIQIVLVLHFDDPLNIEFGINLQNGTTKNILSQISFCRFSLVQLSSPYYIGRIETQLLFKGKREYVARLYGLFTKNHNSIRAPFCKGYKGVF